VRLLCSSWPSSSVTILKVVRTCAMTFVGGLLPLGSEDTSTKCSPRAMVACFLRLEFFVPCGFCALLLWVAVAMTTFLASSLVPVTFLPPTLVLLVKAGSSLIRSSSARSATRSTSFDLATSTAECEHLGVLRVALLDDAFEVEAVACQHFANFDGREKGVAIDGAFCA